MKRLIVKKDSYYDSVFLMLISRELKGEPGVTDAIVAMATDMNRELLGNLGYDPASLSGLSANDLLVAVDASDGASCEKAAAKAEELINRKKTKAAAGGIPKVGSLDAAARANPDANLAVISLPGAFAAREARKALERGLHVMLFSDNVSLEEEVALKELAASKGLLLMGPDCGTSIVGGHPICFANVVKRGSVGIVAASGTGLQEVSCLVDRYGSGVSQGIGTGGRDLKNAKVGGRTMLLAIEALIRDPATKVIVVVSKPPAADMASKVVDTLKAGGKAAVVHFLGTVPATASDGAVRFALNLEEAARLASAIDQGKAPAPSAEGTDPASLEALAAREAAKVGKGQKWLRGLYTGGTLADEALFLLDRPLGGVW
jgi:succinyl-CoA synthetase alpha subunit